MHSTPELRFLVDPGAPGAGLRGRLRVPGDKSISHRAIMLGAIADGETLADKELRQMCWFSKGIVEKSNPQDTTSVDQDALVPTTAHPAPADEKATTAPWVLLPVAAGVPRGIGWNCDENQIQE